MFGSGSAGALAKAANAAILDKPITSELGGVSPTIVIPGRWSTRDLRHQAQHIATQNVHNGGFNCVASQIAILSSGWPQKDAFLAELRAALATAPGRPAYYPGADARTGYVEFHVTGSEGSRPQQRGRLTRQTQKA